MSMMMWDMVSFNSRAREGRDSLVKHWEMAGSPFQLTRPRGARRRVLSLSTLPAKFQLTRPRGARHVLSEFLERALEFQLTRPRGARPATR